MQLHDYLICVATVNGPARLENFIKSVIANTGGFDYKISITDDCSSHDLSRQNHEIANKYNCYYTRNANRSGVPYSWNRATEQADANYIVIANDDILVVPGWLDAYREFWNANKHLKLGVLAWPATGKLGDQSTKRNFIVGPDHSHIVTPIVACIGYLFALPRPLFLEMGKFDERYFATWEEIDMGAKLCMNGYKSIGLDGPIVWHQGGASFSDPINQHPAMAAQSKAKDQWIDKWSLVLNINKHGKAERQMIIDISNALTAKINNYAPQEFNVVKIDLDIRHKLDTIPVDNNIHGWFDFDDIYKEMVFRAQDNAKFVEVGSWLGKSACYMGNLIKVSNKNINFDCIDVWSDFAAEIAYVPEINDSQASGVSLKDKFVNNMIAAGVAEYVHPIQSWSWEGATKYDDNSLNFVFLDAAHDYESVKKDLSAWWPKVKVGGVFAGHDYLNAPDGVGRAVREFFNIHRVKIISRRSSWLVEKYE